MDASAAIYELTGAETKEVKREHLRLSASSGKSSSRAARTSRARARLRERVTASQAPEAVVT
jgi:hypothetical protein